MVVSGVGAMPAVRHSMHQDARHNPDHRNPALAPSGHIPAIDGLRGVAVLMVVIAHTILIRPLNALDQTVADVLGAGWSGVDLFFVLSGFLITGILFDAKGGTRYFSSFYMRRTLRIFPVYYLALFILLIVLPRITIPQAEAYRGLAEHQGWFWFHLSNIHFAQSGFTGDATDVFWSLAIEEQFYLVWPLVVWLCGRRTLMRICVALIITAWAVRVGMIFAGVKPVAIYVLPFARMDGLAAGGFIALLVRGARPVAVWLPAARVLVMACCIGLAIIVATTGGLAIWGRETQMWGYTLLVGLFAATLVLTLNQNGTGWLHRLLTARVLQIFGKYSYAIYIAHLPIRMVLRTIGLDLHAIPPVLGSNLPGQLLFTLAVIICSLLLAMVSWHLLEKRILALKRYFPYQTPRPAHRASATDEPPVAQWIPDQPALR